MSSNLLISTSFLLFSALISLCLVPFSDSHVFWSYVVEASAQNYLPTVWGDSIIDGGFGGFTQFGFPFFWLGTVLQTFGVESRHSIVFSAWVTYATSILILSNVFRKQLDIRLFLGLALLAYPFVEIGSVFRPEALICLSLALATAALKSPDGGVMRCAVASVFSAVAVSTHPIAVVLIMYIGGWLARKRSLGHIFIYLILTAVFYSFLFLAQKFWAGMPIEVIRPPSSEWRFSNTLLNRCLQYPLFWPIMLAIVFYGFRIFIRKPCRSKFILAAIFCPILISAIIARPSYSYMGLVFSPWLFLISSKTGQRDGFVKVVTFIVLTISLMLSALAAGNRLGYLRAFDKVEYGVQRIGLNADGNVHVWGYGLEAYFLPHGQLRVLTNAEYGDVARLHDIVLIQSHLASDTQLAQGFQLLKNMLDSEGFNFNCVLSERSPEWYLLRVCKGER